MRDAVAKMRESIAALVTLCMTTAFIVATLILLVAAGRWVLADDGDDLARGVVVWCTTYLVLNLWSLTLRKLN